MKDGEFHLGPDRWLWETPAFNFKTTILGSPGREVLRKHEKGLIEGVNTFYDVGVKAE